MSWRGLAKRQSGQGPDEKLQCHVPLVRLGEAVDEGDESDESCTMQTRSPSKEQQWRGGEKIDPRRLVETLN